MGSSTDIFLAHQAEAARRTAKARSDELRATQEARLQLCQQNAGAWRELRTRIPQFAELVSAKGWWEIGDPNFKRTTYEYCLRYEQGDHRSLYLYMRRTIFGTIKYSVGPYWDWRTPERTSFRRISIFYASPAEVLQIVNARINHMTPG